MVLNIYFHPSKIPKFMRNTKYRKYFYKKYFIACTLVKLLFRIMHLQKYTHWIIRVSISGSSHSILILCLDRIYCCCSFQLYRCIIKSSKYSTVTIGFVHAIAPTNINKLKVNFTTRYYYY